MVDLAHMLVGSFRSVFRIIHLGRSHMKWILDVFNSVQSVCIAPTFMLLLSIVVLCLDLEFL